MTCGVTMPNQGWECAGREKLMRLLMGGFVISAAVLGLGLAAVAQSPGAPAAGTPSGDAGTSAAPNQIPSGAPADRSSPASGGAEAGAPEPANVVAGPLEEQRRVLLRRIMLAGKLGIGTGPYMAAFNNIEQMVSSGASAEDIQKRVESVRSSLSAQVERMREIKQRPLQGVTKASPASPQAAAPSEAGGGTLDQLKQKYGSQIRDALANPETREKLANPEVRERLMQSPLGQKLIEKLQQGQ